MDAIQRTLNDWEMVDARLDALFVMSEDGVKLSQEERLIEALKGCPVYGATDEELAELLKIRHSSVCARRNGIIAKNPSLLYVAGKRKGSAGIFVDVWKINEVI